jgi:asparagine synthase (glutamine-hydrolysing)
MCGIAGLISLDGSPVSADLLRRLAESLAPRGPDERQIWIDPDRPTAGLAFARLAIIDRAGGRQPMADLDRPGRRVVFNGEIYNHRELRAALQSRGHRFASDHSDTEVLLPLFDEHGPALVDHLRGMFAFAIYDGPAQRLLLARDRLGQKPLYWTITRYDRTGTSPVPTTAKGTFFAFASELKTLMLVPGVSRDLDLEALHLYLQLGYVPSPQTIFRGIQKLPPASRLVVPLDRWPTELAAECYWRMPTANGNNTPDYHRGLVTTTANGNGEPGCHGGRCVPPCDSRMAQLRDSLAEAVKIRLEADVPLGFFLSGGLDSSIVLALARQAEPARRLRTFSVAFPDERYDESRYAELMAAHVGAEHTRLDLAPAQLRELLPAVCAAADEPFADSSIIPTWLLSREVRRHVTVALSGDGGDELFGGYERYRAARLAGALDRLGPLRCALQLVGRCVLRGRDLKSCRSRMKRFTDALGLPPLERYARWVSPFHEGGPLAFYGPRLREAAEPEAAVEYLRSHLPPGQGAGPEFTDAMMSLDARTYLPEDVLTKVDRASMAHGLEVRSPLLDHHVVELAMTLSASEKLGGGFSAGGQKRLLREACRDLLPPEILARRKMGFGVPVSAWLGTSEAEWMRRRLAEGPLAASGLVDGGAMIRYIAEHVSRRADHGPRLYSLLVLDEFLRTHS